MHTSPMNVESSSFDQRFLKVNDSAVESSQVSWLQSPSLEEKKQNNTWHSATFQYHLARGTSQRGGRREAAFINVAFYRIRYGCAYTDQCVLSFHSHRCASDVAVEEVEYLQPWSRCVLLIWTVLVRFLHPPWQGEVFAQRGLGRDKGWNSNSYSTANLSVSITWEAWGIRE